MREIKENIKKYLLVKYADTRLNECTTHLSKSIPWIQRKSLINTIETHFKVLLNSLINQERQQTLRLNKFIVDLILKYTLGKSESMLKTTKNAKDIKTYMQLNSFIVFDEVRKGVSLNKNKRTIKFNIEKQMSEIQEKINSKVSMEEILEEKITA